MLLKLLFPDLIAIVLATTEEILFRALAFRYLLTSTTRWAVFRAMIVSVIVFALTNRFDDPLSWFELRFAGLLIGLTLLGCLLALIYYLTNSLACSIGAHTGLIWITLAKKTQIIQVASSGWGLPHFRQFPEAGGQFEVQPPLGRYIFTETGRQWHGQGVSALPGVYLLLCMFNGFAFPWPLCRPIKVNLTGVGFTFCCLCAGGSRAPVDAGRNWGTTSRMGSISRYIFRTTFGAFAIVLVSLTAVIWVTQALRDFDLMTSQGQNILVFVGITGLIIPLLILVIAPIALLIAVVHVLNKLSTDSEIIVMNSAGMSPWFLFRAFMTVALVVSLLVTAISAYFAPKGLRMLRDWLTEVRANVVSTIVQPGRFTSIEHSVMIHIRERRNDGVLVGIFLDDRRNPNERITVHAETGELLDNDNGTYLVLQKGIVQRYEIKERDPAMVVFDRYAFDLSQFAGGPQSVKYSIRERYLWQLMFPDPKDPFYVEQPGQFRAEMHDRLVAPLYPFAFVVIAFTYLGAPRTTRQSRTMSLIGAISGVGLLRLTGFVSTVFGVNTPWILSLQYLALIFAFVLGMMVIRRGIILEPPAFLAHWMTAVIDRVNRQFATS